MAKKSIIEEEMLNDIIKTKLSITQKRWLWASDMANKTKRKMKAVVEF